MQQRQSPVKIVLIKHLVSRHAGVYVIAGKL